MLSTGADPSRSSTCGNRLSLEDVDDGESTARREKEPKVSLGERKRQRDSLSWPPHAAFSRTGLLTNLGED